MDLAGVHLLVGWTSDCTGGCLRRRLLVSRSSFVWSENIGCGLWGGSGGVVGGNVDGSFVAFHDGGEFIVIVIVVVVVDDGGR